MGTSNPPQEAPQNWGVFVPGFTLLILRGNKQQHSSWMSSAIEKKKRIQRRRNQIHLNFSYCGCVSGSHLSTPQADKTKVIGHEGSSTAAKTGTPPSNSGTWWGKGEQRGVRTNTKYEIHFFTNSSNNWMPKVPVTHSFCTYTGKSNEQLSLPVNSFHYKSISEGAKGMEEETAKIWGTPRHKRTTRAFSHQQKEFLLEKCIRNSRGKNW